MGNDKAGSPVHQGIHPFLDQRLGHGVHRTGRLIHDEYLGVGQHRAGEADQLLLANREPAPSLANLPLIPILHRDDELVGASEAGGRLHLFVGGIQPAVADILADGAGEQVRRLQNDPNPRLNRIKLQPGIILADEADRAPRGLVEATDQVDDRRLASTGRTDQRNRLTALDLEVQARQHRFVFFVSKVHVIELDFTSDRPWIGGALSICHLWLGVDQRKDPLGRGDCILRRSPHPGHVLDWPQHKGNV